MKAKEFEFADIEDLVNPEVLSDEELYREAQRLFKLMPKTPRWIRVLAGEGRLRPPAPAKTKTPVQLAVEAEIKWRREVHNVRYPKNRLTVNPKKVRRLFNEDGTRKDDQV